MPSSSEKVPPVLFWPPSPRVRVHHHHPPGSLQFAEFEFQTCFARVLRQWIVETCRFCGGCRRRGWCLRKTCVQKNESSNENSGDYFRPDYRTRGLHNCMRLLNSPVGSK